MPRTQPRRRSPRAVERRLWAGLAAALTIYCLGPLAALAPAAAQEPEGRPSAPQSPPVTPATERTPPPSIPAPPLGRLGESPAANAAAASAAGDPVDDLESLTPPDGKWSKDEEGREFFVTRLKKVPGTYDRMPGEENWIRYKGLYRWTFTHEDAEYFYIKAFRVIEEEADLAQQRVREEQLRRAGIEESYRFEDRRVDRLVFSPFDQGLPREGQWRQGFDVADMNGDGHLDIVHGPPRKAIFTPVVFLGDGAGNWRYWDEVTWPDLDFDYGDAAAADVNGDGLMDIGLGIHLRGLKVLIQERPGRFVDGSAGLHYEVPGQGGDASGFASRAVEFEDWNGDGRPDLVALGEGARQASTVRGETDGLPATTAYGVVVFLNQGGTSWKPLSAGTAHGVFGDSFALGDWNGDGRPDVAASSYAMGARDILFLNADTSIGFEQVVLESLRPRAFTFSVTGGDFDGDGRADLVTAFGTTEGDLPRSGLELHVRDAKGVWHARVLTVEHGGESAWAIDSGDLDGDGHLDVVATTHRGGAIVMLGDGAGGFAREESPELDTPKACRGYTTRLVDLDGDGRPELVASFAAETGEIKRFLGEPECKGEGELRVWRVGPAAGSPRPVS